MHTAQASRQVQGMIIGGGLGPFQTYNRPCEVAADITFTSRGLESNNSLVGFADKGEELPEFRSASNSYIATMGQFFVTEAKPGKVIQIEAKGRNGGQNIFDMIQGALYEKYRGEELPMGVGGVFFLNDSSAQVSLLNAIPGESYHTYPCVRSYKTPFSINGPIVGAGTIISHDPTSLGYMMKSFYCWNTARTLMGQFEYDNNPANAHFQIYLTVATQIYRHDRPVYRI
nr:Ester hydrolase C11orf54 protein [Hymenolepis microstoma]